MPGPGHKLPNGLGVKVPYEPGRGQQDWFRLLQINTNVPSHVTEHPALSFPLNKILDRLFWSSTIVSAEKELPGLWVVHQPDGSAFCSVNTVLPSSVTHLTWGAPWMPLGAVPVWANLRFLSLPEPGPIQGALVPCCLCPSAWPTPSGVAHTWNSNGSPAEEMCRALITMTSIATSLKGG